MHLALTASAALPCQRAVSHPAGRAVSRLHVFAVATAAYTAAACAATATPTSASAPPPPPTVAVAAASHSAPAAAAAASAATTARRVAPAHHLARAVQREYSLSAHLRHPLRHHLERRPRRLHVHEDPITAATVLLCISLLSPAPASAA